MGGNLETCENCGRQIGRLETAHVHGEHIVCAECKDRLTPAELDYSSIVETPLRPAAPDVLEEIARSVPARAEARRLPPACPACGAHVLPVQKAKGSTGVGCLLCLVFIPIGIIYFIMYSGYVYTCPACGMKRGDVI